MQHSEPFRVFAIDFFHAHEENNTYEVAAFETYEEALAKARAIVAESVRSHQYDLKLHNGFGDGAYILGPLPEGAKPFRHWEYAEELCEKETGI